MLTSTVSPVIICALVQTCVSSLMCVHKCVSRRVKIYFISEIVLYNLCYLLHHLSPREHCIQGVMMSARLYNIKRIIWSPSPQQWNEIYLTCYLSYVYTLFSLRFILGFTSSPEIILKKLLHTLFILSYSCLLCPSSSTILFIFLIATFLLSLCRSLSVCLFSSPPSLCVDGQIR